MRFFDLHCDTLYRAVKENKDFFENDFHVSLEKTLRYDAFVSCFALWIPDNVRKIEAVNFFETALKKIELQQNRHKNSFEVLDFSKKIESHNFKNKIILTVEGGAVLNGDIKRVKYLSERKVKILTLTWNGACELGDGAEVKNSEGLTKFGRSAVREMEKCGIIADVSHASEKLFYDVAQIAEKPFIATHSNSKKVCGHARNLSDEQFKIIKSVGGIVGITFCKDFLNSAKNPNFDDILNHAEHFLSLGGENILAFGSDFDGCDIPLCMKGVESVQNLFEYFLKKNYSEKLLEKMFFDNAKNFMNKYF